MVFRLFANPSLATTTFVPLAKQPSFLRRLRSQSALFTAHGLGQLWRRARGRGVEDGRNLVRILQPVANRPRFGCYLRLPIGAYWGPPMSTVISVSI